MISDQRKTIFCFCAFYHFSPYTLTTFFSIFDLQLFHLTRSRLTPYGCLLLFALRSHALTTYVFMSSVFLFDIRLFRLMSSALCLRPFFSIFDVRYSMSGFYPLPLALIRPSVFGLFTLCLCTFEPLPLALMCLCPLLLFAFSLQTFWLLFSTLKTISCF